MDDLLYEDSGAIAEQVQRVRSALGELNVDVDVSRLAAALGPAEGVLPTAEAYRKTLPVLQPSASETIIAGRADRF